jgi:hypothetical protein
MPRTKASSEASVGTSVVTSAEASAIMRVVTSAEENTLVLHCVQ